MITDLERAFNAITKKQKLYTDLFNYYDGDQPILYLTSQLREIFRNIDINFVLNICSVVIDATKERINFHGFTSKDSTINDSLAKLVESQELINEADETHEGALVTGEAYIIVWPEVVEGEPTGEVEIFYNDPRNVHMFYDAANPKQPRYAAKLWQSEDNLYHLTLYYPDRLEYYITQKSEDEAVKLEAKSFIPDISRSGVLIEGDSITWPENPYDQIPVFHYQLGKRKTKSDLKNVTPLQDGINKLLSDMIVTAEYMAGPQRYVISNADTSNLKNKIGGIWDLPAAEPGDQPTQAGQFDMAALENYLKSIDSLISYASSITSTPKHYFDPSTGAAPSGEALIAMEAPLNKKVQDRIDKFTPVWKKVAAFALKILNIEIDPVDITVNFAKPETVQPRTSAEITQIETQSGVPLAISLKRQGWTESELSELEKVRQAEDEKSKASLAVALLNYQRQFNSGNGNGNGNNPVNNPAAGDNGNANSGQ